jgi:hypothetical protein
MLFFVEQFYRDGDSNDWLPAVNRAQREWNASATQPNTDRGFTLLFGPREYTFSNSVHLVRGMTLVGSGGATSYNGTILRFPPDKHGIVCDRPTTAPPNAPGAGDNLVVERVVLKGQGRSAANAPPAHGVVMNASTILRDVYVGGFSGNGIHIVATLPHASASLWQVQNCTVAFCEHGLFADGADANAGCAIALDCRDNRGWGVYDSSFLGNTFIACHTNNNAKGPYETDDPNQRSMFLNCYSEQNQPPSDIAPPSMVVGGLHGAGVTGGGYTLLGALGDASGASGPLRLQTDVDTPDGPKAAFVTVGTAVPGIAGYLSFWRPGAPEASSYLRYVNSAYPYAPYKGDWFGFNWARLDGGWSLMMPLDGHTAKVRVSYDANRNIAVDRQARMSPAFPQGGFHWGPGFNWFGEWPEGGPTTSGTWEETDTLMNRLANSSGHPWSGWIGAICTSGGTAGTYEEGRTASTNGTNAVVLNSPSSVLKVGDFVVIKGVTSRIASVSGANLTLTQDIPAGTGLSIAWKPPTWKKFGALEP